jgi:phage shock protein PspC (stress-responsive transcriptional regulator)
MSDQEKTDQMPEAEPPTEPQPESPGRRGKRLIRSRSDRMLGGVAGGLGTYFDVDALIFRIAFGVSVFFGGLGAVAYLALLLFVPSEEDDGTIGEAPFQRSRAIAIAAAVGIFIFLASWGIFDGDPFWFDGPWFFGGPLFVIAIVAALFYLLRRDRDERTSPRGILATVAIALAATVGLSVLALAAAWAGATGSGEAVAGVIITIGVLLVIAAFRGGARWLVIPAVALALPLSAVAAADVSFDGGIGQRDYEPAGVASIPDDGYELGMGQLNIDLRSIDWRPDTIVDLRADLGVGQLNVAVPESVCITGDLDVGAGAVEVGGEDVDGFDVDHQPEAGTTATPRLVLDGEVDLGHMQVINDDDVDLDDERGFRRTPNENDLQAAMDAACSPDQPERPQREDK